MKTSHAMFSNEKGALTTDFLFAFCLSLGFVMLVLTITITLSVTEITQYISFASARAFSASHVNLEAQQANGQAKFAELKSNRGFGAIFFNGWFELGSGDLGVEVDDFSQEYPSSYKTFQGARIAFVSHLLSFNVPFFGSTDTQSDGFRATVASYLGREPTFVECHENFNQQRWQQIQSLLGYVVPTNNAESYINLSDNGC